MIRSRGKAYTKATLALAVLSLLPSLVSAGITARLQHGEIPVDRATRLMVSLSGSSKGKPDIPEVPGLQFIPTGTSSQMQFVNGQMSSAVTYTFQVQAAKPGDYTIPGISADINGKVESSEPLRLRVVQAVGSAPRSSRRLQPGLPAPRPGAPQVAPKGEIGREAAFLELETRKGQLYMGEMIPVAIKAYFREGLGVSVAPPQLTGDAFVLHNLSDDPKQTRVRVGEGVYTMLTWNTAISAIKEGRYPINAKLDATIQVPTQGRRRSFGGSLFDDDFFGQSFFNDDFFNRFFGGVEERQVELAAKPHRIRVKPLPEEGRPEDFSGAVGQFKLSVKAKPTKVEAGDPITLEMAVSGRGNFDRVTVPLLSDQAGWKTYDPSDTFKPSDVSGYRGVKRFEQPVVPEIPEIKAVPPVRFSYFDTRKKKYATLVSKSIPIQVTGVAAAPLVARSSQPRSQGGSTEAGRGADLVPIHLEVGRRTSLEPLATQPWFLGLQAVPLSALLIGLLLYRRNAKTLASPDWVQKRESDRKVSESRRAMQLAARSGDTAGFVNASQRAVREQLAPLWQLRGDAITLAELNVRLPHGYEGIRRVFVAADALAYGGQPLQAGDLEAWHREVVSELDGLTHELAGEER